MRLIGAVNWTLAPYSDNPEVNLKEDYPWLAELEDTTNALVEALGGTRVLKLDLTCYTQVERVKLTDGRQSYRGVVHVHGVSSFHISVVTSSYTKFLDYVRKQVFADLGVERDVLVSYSNHEAIVDVPEHTGYAWIQVDTYE